MARYIVFVKDGYPKAFLKSTLSKQTISDIKSWGYTRHHVEVDAENEGEAIKKVGDHDKAYFHDLKDYTGVVLFCTGISALILIIYLVIQ